MLRHLRAQRYTNTWAGRKVRVIKKMKTRRGLNEQIDLLGADAAVRERMLQSHAVGLSFSRWRKCPSVCVRQDEVLSTRGVLSGKY